MVVRDAVGVISRITDITSKECTGPQGKFTVFSIGIQFEDQSWHNIQNTNSQTEAQKVLDKLGGGKYVVGDSVKVYEESKDGKYWRVTSIVQEGQPTEEVVKTKDEMEATLPKPKTEDIIVKQCCLKAAAMTGGITSKEEVIKTAQWYFAQLDQQWLG